MTFGVLSHGQVSINDNVNKNVTLFNFVIKDVTWTLLAIIRLIDLFSLDIILNYIILHFYFSVLWNVLWSQCGNAQTGNYIF